MKIFHSFVGVLLFIISPILSYYINDDSSKVGYVSVQNSGRSFERRGFRGMQRRHFAGSHRHKNDNIVDSHFKVKKTQQHLPYQSAENSRGEAPTRRWNTDAPIHLQTKQVKENVEHTGRQQEQMALANQIGRSTDKGQGTQPLLNVQRSRPINAEYRAQNAQRSQNIKMHSYQDIHQNRYDAKPNFVEMNVHKTQISTNPQKIVRLNNNQQITSISVHQPDEKYQKVPASLAVDKTLQKVSLHSERNSQMMSRVLDEMAHKIPDRKFKGDYKKRDTEYNDHNYKMDRMNRNFVSESMRKYIVGKDKAINTERKNLKEFSRIGSHEDSVEPEDSPYAIFYRMHPDTLDEQEGFISMGSMEDNTNVFNNKKKRHSGGYDSKKTKNSNVVKIQGIK